MESMQRLGFVAADADANAKRRLPLLQHLAIAVLDSFDSHDLLDHSPLGPTAGSADFRDVVSRP